MRTNRKNEKGFTLIELVVVIAVLAILAGVAVPQFISIAAKAKEAAEAEDVKAIRAGIRLKAIEAQVKNPSSSLVYPASLETGNANAVFENVLDLQSALDLKTRGWLEAAANSYTSQNANTWSYVAADGTFLKQ